MELLCPECRGRLETSDGQTARCTIHGGQFQILHSRWRPPVSPPEADAAPELEFALVPGTVCAQHPAVPAVDVCRRCGTPVCETCAFPASHGGQLCPNCASREVADGPPELPRRPRLPVGVYCVQHPHLTAAAQCKRCGAYMCATCDFALPDGNHFCPACATASQTELSPQRKRALGWAYGLAIWSTLMLLLLFSGALVQSVETEAEQTAIGMVFLVVVLFPSIAGISVGVSARSRQASNPLSLWIAIVWNSVILGIYLLLCVIGSMS